MVYRASARARVRGVRSGLLYRGACGGMEDEDKVDGGDSDEMRGVEEAELGAVSVVNNEPRRNSCTSING